MNSTGTLGPSPRPVKQKALMRHRESVSARSRIEHHEQSTPSCSTRHQARGERTPPRSPPSSSATRPRSPPSHAPSSDTARPFSGSCRQSPAPFAARPRPHPLDRTICLRSRTSHSGAPVAIASFYGKCRVGSTIESRRHDSPHAAESDRKSTPSPHTMRAIHGHALHSPKPARQVKSTRKPIAASCPHTLLAHRRANAPAPAATPILKGRTPATSKQA